MKKLYILAALLLATTSAHAGGISFQINGERVRIEAPRNCNAISCIKVISPGYTGTLGNVDLKGMGKKKDDDDVVTSAPARAAGTRAGPGRRAAAARSRSGSGDPAPAPTTVATATPSRYEAAPPAPPAPPAPVAPAPAPLRLPHRRVRPELADRHLGDGREQGQRAHRGMRRQSVRLFRQHRRRILINMKPQGSKWTGRIHDPESGRNYDSTIALKSTDTLKVQGCAFGGMFCGGQTWKRVS